MISPTQATHRCGGERTRRAVLEEALQLKRAVSACITVKNNYFFTLGAPATEERNFILFYREASLTEESISTRTLAAESGEKYPLFPLSELKKYLSEHKWTVLYRDSIKTECDNELTDFIRLEKILVIESDDDFDRFLEEYYKVHTAEA